MPRLSKAWSTGWIAWLRLALVLLAIAPLGGASKVHARVATSEMTAREGSSWTAASQSDEGDEDDGDDDDSDDDDSGE